ncbi:hypothetical protein BDR06DRAFT_761744 [Suillus hirtellus]|nr:hypothetical protein BDR06DRAFT_761744 [Suillus hirtellus]
MSSPSSKFGRIICKRMESSLQSYNIHDVSAAAQPFLVSVPNIIYCHIFIAPVSRIHGGLSLILSCPNSSQCRTTPSGGPSLLCCYPLTPLSTRISHMQLIVWCCSYTIYYSSRVLPLLSVGLGNGYVFIFMIVPFHVSIYSSISQQDRPSVSTSTDQVGKRAS